MTVTLEIAGLRSAITKLDALVAAIGSARNRALLGTPTSLPSLTDSSALARKAAWLTDQKAEVLQPLLDLAILLDDTHTGSVSFVGSSDIDSINAKLAAELAKQLATPPVLGTSSEDLNQLLEIARRAGLDPTAYADVLQLYYVTKAAEKAGIDLTTWDVSLGAEAVSEHYELTYAYYAQLMLDNPNFRWAGMAAMIGPSFAAGFEDIEFFQTMARDLADKLGPVPDWLLPFPVNQLDEVSDLGADELKFYQTTFLQMQKDIFYDASMMHEAYLEGGLGNIEELRQAGLLGTDPQQADQAYDAWRKIDTASRAGDVDMLNEGNEDLLRREQFYTIADQYQDMKNHDPTGEVMTYMMGLVGQPSIPGSHTLGEVDDPITFQVDTMPLVPGVQGGEVSVNIPRSNIADFDTRWGLIEDDTLPAYLDLLKNDPDRVNEILNQDVRERIDEMRLSERWPDILDSLVDTDVRLW